MVEILLLLYFRGKWRCSLLSLLTISNGDKVTVKYRNVKGVIIPGGMIKDVSRTGVRLEFPHMVKFQTDSCLERGSMIICHDST